jgi:Flp pilus assembly protein TadD/ferredoxin
MNSPSAPDTAPSRPRDYSRRRAACLAGAYVLMAAHVVHWKLAGRTLAPLELNEVMYTLELGILTAGFLFMAAAMLATLLFGRFFCSWGCHILALEDLCAWLLGRLRIRPRPVRSRVLAFVPLIAMTYMFIWPQASRWWAGRALPDARVLTDEQGWASFLTSNFWRNLPGPGVTLLTFAMCGFAIVYLLGSRAFCTYACPYGAAFRFADRFAPGRIKAVRDCSQCGTCTAVCQSHVRVHEEVAALGRIVDPACLKDLDCVAACPNGALQYGLGRPAIFDLLAASKLRRTRYDFSPGEDALMAAVFLLGLFVFRGLYGLAPFLLSLALGGMLAFLSVVCVRLARWSHVRLNPFQLKIQGRLTGAGRGFAAGAALLGAFTLHSGLVRYHEFTGDRLARAALAGPVDASNPAQQSAARQALAHLTFCDTWGLVRGPDLSRRLALLHLRGATPVAAEPHLRCALRLRDDADLRRDLARLLADRGALAEAVVHMQAAGALDPASAETAYDLAVMFAVLGREDEAIGQYRRALALNDADPEAHNNLGLLLARRGAMQDAADHLRRAIALRADYAHPHFNLAQVLEAAGRADEARSEYRVAARLDPRFVISDPRP